MTRTKLTDEEIARRSTQYKTELGFFKIAYAKSLKDDEDISVPEIARIMDLPVETIRRFRKHDLEVEIEAI